MNYLGDFPEDHVGVQIPFNTFSSDDPAASVTVSTLILSDIYVHKDGSATPITTDGATIDIDVNAIAGSHMITIDTSVDAAYAVGGEYAVRIEGATVDGGNINAWVGCFSIERAGGVLALLKGATGLAAIDTNVDNLNLGIIYGATSGTPTTTSTNTDLTGYADSELVGRVIVFTGGTANGQAATILTYTSTSGVVTFAALTTAPAASDTFKIV